MYRYCFNNLIKLKYLIAKKRNAKPRQHFCSPKLMCDKCVSIL